MRARINHSLAIIATLALAVACGAPDTPDELTPTVRPTPNEGPEEKTSTPIAAGTPDEAPPVVKPIPSPPVPAPPVPAPPVPVPVQARAFSGGPVEVDFLAGDFPYAYLRVGDQEFVVEPRRTLELKPRVYPLWVRASDDEEWRKMQALELEPGGPYELRLRRPDQWELTSTGPPPSESANTVTVLAPLPTAPSTDNPVTSPLTGYWREVGRIPCGKGPTFEPEDPIGDFVIFAVGSFHVTWSAFESYHDYNGTYRLDQSSNEFELASLAGNYVPDDIDARGRFKRKGRQLILKDMWLGSSLKSDGSQWGCGHVFEPR